MESFGLSPIQTGGNHLGRQTAAAQGGRREGVMEIDPAGCQRPIVEAHLTLGQTEPETVGSSVMNRGSGSH